MPEIAFLLSLLGLAWLWHDNRYVQEIAVAAARTACQRAGVQFLDETAALSRQWLKRDADGRLRWARLFTFDYSAASGLRGHGRVVTLGKVIVALELDPLD